MPEPIDRKYLLAYLSEIKPNEYVSAFGEAAVQVIGLIEEFVKEMPTIEPEVRHGRWIECDYKHMEHGMIETEPKAGLCCSECRTGFKKKNMTYKQYCPACGAKMYADGGTISKERFAEIMAEILGDADNARRADDYIHKSEEADDAT